MKLLLLNQCFYPDVMATGQQLTHLAVGLSDRGHDVTVVASNRGYDDPTKQFPKRELWNRINIIRISSLNLGKKSKLRRALNFGSFLLNCTLRLALLPRFDVVVALTSPPLISFLGALFTRLKGGRFIFWVMDLNPDEAIAAGWLREHSRVARILSGFLDYSLRHAEKIIVLDRFMKQRILAKGISEQKIVVLPPWSHDDKLAYDLEGRTSFRTKHNLNGKFVVMYSGNHSPCHPLDTLLEAALRLSDRRDVAFCFVGGGSEQQKVRQFAERHQLSNVICFPYQPLNELSRSLSAADLHMVVMGDKFAGIVHPCKVYNVLALGVPLLYIGPGESHVMDIATECNGYLIRSARHGEADAVVNHILRAAENAGTTTQPPESVRMKFSKEVLLPKMIEEIISPA